MELRNEDLSSGIFGEHGITGHDDPAAEVRLRDQKTGARLNLRLAAQHAALALIGAKEKSVVAKYGFE